MTLSVDVRGLGSGWMSALQNFLEPATNLVTPFRLDHKQVISVVFAILHDGEGWNGDFSRSIFSINGSKLTSLVIPYIQPSRVDA